MNRGSILHEDLTYAMLHEMVMKKFNLEAIYPLNLSAKVSSIDDNFDITDNHEKWQKYMSFKPDIPETPLYKSKPMISKDYKKETDVKVGKIFDNKEALDLAIRFKALDKGYQFLNDRSAPERHAAIALPVQDEFLLSYHAVCCRHLMTNLSLKRDKTKALFWRICKAYTTEELSRSMSHLQDIQTDAYEKLCENAASVKVSRDLSRNGARVILSTLQTHRFTNRRDEINNLMVMQDHLLVDYGKYAFGYMTGADMKKCVHIKSVRDELLRSMEEKRQLMANYKDM
nr:transposase, MuDR, MULE transposase domain protein [Tanacetum cinerariifolium]